MKLLVKTLIFGGIILAIDLPWLMFYMKGLYNELFNKLNISMSGNIVAAILAYTVMIISFPFLIEDKDENKMIQKAAILGLVIYGTYGFTLSAFLPHYDLFFALKETIWGILLYTVSTKLTNIIYNCIKI